MISVWYKDQMIAKSEKDDILMIEGNMYFPPNSIKQEYFIENDNTSTCPWKGLAKYYDLEIEGEKVENIAWFYPVPKEGSVEIVSNQNNGKGDFSNYVAFYKDKVDIQEDKI